jgi:proteasome lid subunit RPN8/RPN11
MPTVTIDSWHLDEFRKEARANMDREICGLLVGRFLSEQDESVENINISVSKVVPILNIEPNPLAAFRMDPIQLIKAMEYAYSNNLHVVGCIHSHPLWSSNYSSIDLGAAIRNNDEAVWIIYGGRKDDYSAFYYDKNLKKFFNTNLVNSGQTV